MRKSATLFIGGTLAILLSARVEAVIVSACGQTVNGNAQLAGDLDCSAHDGPSITVTKGTLKLGGFTLTGHPDHTIVLCPGGCKIKGPGTLTGGRDGIVGVSPVRVFGVTITGNSGTALRGSIVRLKDCVITNNGSVNGPDYALTGGAHASTRMVVTRSTIQNNLNFGVFTSTATIGRATTITGNGTNADCAASPYAISLGCADLSVANWRRGPVVLKGSECGRSQRLYEPIGLNWGACTND